MKKKSYQIFLNFKKVKVQLWYNHIKNIFPVTSKGTSHCSCWTKFIFFLLVSKCLRSEVVFLHQRPVASGFCCLNCRSLLFWSLCSSL